MDGKLASDSPRIRGMLSLVSGMPEPVLEPRDFDCVFLHALISSDWALQATFPNVSPDDRYGRFMTKGLISAVILESYRSSVLCHLLAELRKVTDLPVLASPQPYFAEFWFNRPSRKRQGSHPTDQFNWVNAYEKVIVQNVGEAGAVFLPQPAETIAQGTFTRNEYCAGSVRLSPNLDIPHLGGDFVHMNAAYGARVFEDLLADRIATGRPATRGTD